MADFILAIYLSTANPPTLIPRQQIDSYGTCHSQRFENRVSLSIFFSLSLCRPERGREREKRERRREGGRGREGEGGREGGREGEGGRDRKERDKDS